ncbi:MAG: hypothetical protein DRG24_08700 [Epsilonproteobacteria bacterium]|nr:MAG: hypothetical protein DRG24_08700 [Campylobacterota bacterium]
MRILPMMTFLFLTLSIIFSFTACNDNDDNYYSSGECTNFTLSEQQCRLNFVFLEAEHQSCCKAWLKNSFNE